MLVRPYLTFNGNCQEAVDLYVKAFNIGFCGGIIRFKDMPQSPFPLSDEQKEWIMQVALDFKTCILRMSDTLEKINGEPTKFVSVGFEGSLDEVKNAFDVLQEEGTVKQPLAKAFFSEAYGEVVDKFGIEWKLAVTPNC